MTRRTAITDATAPVTAVDPLIEPFALIHLEYRERIARLVAKYTDDELNLILVAFSHTNLGNIPHEFWPVAPRVRHFIQAEQAKRVKRLAALEALTGDTEA